MGTMNSSLILLHFLSIWFCFQKIPSTCFALSINNISLFWFETEFYKKLLYSKILKFQNTLIEIPSDRYSPVSDCLLQGRWSRSDRWPSSPALATGGRHQLAREGEGEIWQLAKQGTGQVCGAGEWGLDAQICI